MCGATQRKPQVRAYLFYCAGHMFVYRAHEVRLPLWEEDEEEEEEGDNKVRTHARMHTCTHTHTETTLVY